MQHITTLLNKTKILASEILGTDILYLIHGSDAKRDRALEISELKKYVSNFDLLKAKTIILKDGLFETTIGSDIIRQKYEVQQSGGTLTYEFVYDPYSVGISLKRNGVAETEIGYGVIKLGSGTFKIEDDSSSFVFDKPVVIKNADGTEEIKLDTGRVVLPGQITVDGRSYLKGGVTVDGNAVFQNGKAEFNGQAEFHGYMDVGKSMRFGKPDGSFSLLSAYADGVQLQNGNFSVTNGSIGDGNSAIVPKSYNAGSNDNCTVSLMDGEFCFVHKNANSTGSFNKLTVKESNTQATADFTGSSGFEYVIIVFRYGNKIYMSRLSQST